MEAEHQLLQERLGRPAIRNEAQRLLRHAGEQLRAREDEQLEVLGAEVGEDGGCGEGSVVSDLPLVGWREIAKSPARRARS